MLKKIIFYLILISPLIIFAQDEDMRPPQREKIRHFMKLKLIEVLDLNEDESIKFFAKYNDLQKNVERLQKNKNDIIDDMHRIIKKGDAKFDEQKFNDLFDELRNIDKESVKYRENFYNSLDDVLPKYKIAKLIVFEREFFRNLRELMKDNPPGQGPGFRRKGLL